MSEVNQEGPELVRQRLMTMPYAGFVAGLFVKPADPEGRLHHATTGIIGEVVELMQANGRENEIEELGDLEFYYQALYNTFTKLGMVPTVPEGTKFPSYRHCSVRFALNEMLFAATDLLDLTKKIWIYAKPLDAAVLDKFGIALHNLRLSIEAYYSLSGLDYTLCTTANREKLLVRYPGAQYTDAAAQARADKSAGA